MSYKPHKVRLILIFEGKILLLKQHKQFGGNYTLVGGTIEAQEFAKQCLIRETKEESGIIISESDLKLAHVLHKKNKLENRITLYFTAQNYRGQLKNREEKKFADVSWHDLNNLPSKLTSTSKQVLKSYLNGELYSEIKK